MSFARLYSGSFCSQTCIDKHKACALEKLLRDLRDKSAQERSLVTKVCKCCNKGFSPAKSLARQFCSQRCSTKAGHEAYLLTEKGKAIKRAAKAKYKVLRRQRCIADSIDPLIVLSRDQWTCRLCGIPTPRELRGSYHHAAPEVDHVIPLAKGGTHTLDNLQCACRQCNGAKADSIQSPGLIRALVASKQLGLPL